MRVDIEILNSWIANNGPDGVAKLAVGAGLSTATIQRARTGRVPKKIATRKAICSFMKISESELFPEQEDNQAS
jgi:transcriptional regulator with XRE-family HTH domain